MIDGPQREQVRKALLQIMCRTSTASFLVSTLFDRSKDMLPDVRYGEHDIEEALAYLEGLALVKQITGELGGYTVKWKSTQQGVFFSERNRYI